MSIPNPFRPVCGKPGGELPPGFKRSLYLRSSADQYIDPGLIVSQGMRVMLDVEFLEAGTGSFNGTVKDHPISRFTVACQASTGHLRIACGETETDNGIPAFGIRHKVELGTDATASVDGSAVELVAGSPPYGEAFWLFARQQEAKWESYAFPATQKLYRFKAWVDGAVVRDMVPAVRVADGKPCMIDMVTGMPYFNKRNGADFTTNFDE